MIAKTAFSKIWQMFSTVFVVFYFVLGIVIDKLSISSFLFILMVNSKKYNKKCFYILL